MSCNCAGNEVYLCWQEPNKQGWFTGSPHVATQVISALDESRTTAEDLERQLQEIQNKLHASEQELNDAKAKETFLEASADAANEELKKAKDSGWFKDAAAPKPNAEGAGETQSERMQRDQAHKLEEARKLKEDLTKPKGDTAAASAGEGSGDEILKKPKQALETLDPAFLDKESPSPHLEGAHLYLF